MGTYLPRVVDDELTAALRRSGAVLIEGPKACGKTSTALRRSRTVVRLDNTRDAQVAAALDVDPSLLLVGDPPVLLDEWQVAPALWNLVRHEVDAQQAAGRFILTGSSTPDDSVRRHSGAGRFATIQMRPMSLFELGQSSGQVSLAALFDGATPSGFDPTWETTKARHEIAEIIAVGGWPANIGKSSDDAFDANRDYIEVIASHDIQTVAGVKRNPATVARVMRSLARVVATPAKNATIALDLREGDDVPGSDATSRPTVVEHLDALRRLRIVEDQPAWTPGLRSARRPRTSPKRHFVDPCLAAAALGADARRLAADPLTLGFLFESLVVRDLRVYAQRSRGSVAYYRDNRALEVDAIVELPDGRWGAIEVKLGTTPRVIDDAAANLRALGELTDPNRRAFLAVVTNGGIAHRRADGVIVIPIRMLAP